MDRERRSEIVTGLFVVAAVGVFGLFAFRVGRWEWLSFLKGHRIHAVTGFAEAKTLAVGSKVIVAGRPVGEVTAIHLVQRPIAPADLADIVRSLPGSSPAAGQLRTVVDVEFDIVDAGLRIDPASARVAMVQDGLLGNHYLELVPGFFPPEAVPPTVAERAADQVLKLQSVQAGALDTLLPLLTETVQSAQDVLVGINDHILGPSNRDAIGKVLGDVTVIAEAVRRLVDADDDASVQATLLQPARQTLRSLESTVANADHELRSNLLPKLDRMLDRGDTVLGAAHQLAAELRAAVADVQRHAEALLAGGEAMVAENRANLADSLLRLRGSMWQAELALRKIRANPAVLIFGDSESDLEASPMDTTEPRRTGRAGIYRQRGEDDGGK